jgi:hypothetical protein
MIGRLHQPYGGLDNAAAVPKIFAQEAVFQAECLG